MINQISEGTKDLDIRQSVYFLDHTKRRAIGCIFLFMLSQKRIQNRMSVRGRSGVVVC